MNVVELVLIVVDVALVKEIAWENAKRNAVLYVLKLEEYQHEVLRFQLP